MAKRNRLWPTRIGRATLPFNRYHSFKYFVYTQKKEQNLWVNQHSLFSQFLGGSYGEESPRFLFFNTHEAYTGLKVANKIFIIYLAHPTHILVLSFEFELRLGIMILPISQHIIQKLELFVVFLVTQNQGSKQIKAHQKDDHESMIIFTWMKIKNRSCNATSWNYVADDCSR